MTDGWVVRDKMFGVVYMFLFFHTWDCILYIF